MATGIEKFIQKIAVQPAVYWAMSGNDGYGKASFENPVQIWVRWDDKQENILDKDGKETITSSQILTPTELATGGMIILGILQDIGLDTEPYTAGAFEIIKYEKIPLFKRANAFVRKAYLSRGGQGR